VDECNTLVDFVEMEWNDKKWNYSTHYRASCNARVFRCR
jgi:hypothetical protein